MSAQSPSDDYEQQVLAYGQDWGVILRCESDVPLYAALRADFYVARLDVAAARRELQAVRMDDVAAESRGARMVKAMRQWIVDGDMNASYSTWLELVRADPTDLFALKRGQLLAFLMGDAAKMVEISEVPSGELANEPYYHGMLSFALEQAGRVDEALEAGLRGVEVCPDDAWAHHAVAHALLAKGEHQRGLAFLNERQASWEGRLMSFLYTHLHFHRALFMIALGDFGAADRVLRTRIWPLDEEEEEEDKKTSEEMAFSQNDKTYWQDQLAALGIAWKLEIHADAPDVALDVVESVLEHVSPLPTPYMDPLFDLHVVHALKRTNRTEDAAAMVDSMEKAAHTSELRDIWLSAGRALLHRDASKHMSEALRQSPKRLSVVSGSQEQREVVHEQLAALLGPEQGKAYMERLVGSSE